MRRLSAKLESFLPRSGSAPVFVVTMACYSWVAAGFISSIVYLLHFRPPPPSVWELRGLPLVGVISNLLVAPLLETCILIGAIELLRWLKSPGWLQVFLAAAILAGPHALGGAARICCHAGIYHPGGVIPFLETNVSEKGLCRGRLYTRVK
jgi:hypothetical protein